MKITRSFGWMAIMMTVLILASGCKKKNEESSQGPVPVVVTGNYNNVLLNTLEISGSVSNNYGYIVTRCGFCWSTTNQYPKITDDTIVIPANPPYSFSGIVKGLKGQTKYYIRAFATNKNGSGYGMVVPVTTMDSMISDIDNNHYRLVQIGPQVWMAENLKTTRFNDGEVIPLTEDNATWAALASPSYCWNSNDISYKVPYGALYNWYAAHSGIISPVGFHVPTKDDWIELIDFLGGVAVAAGALKEAGQSHWEAPNTGADNSSGFTALPGGNRDPTGSFFAPRLFGGWWTSTEKESNLAWAISVSFNTTQVSITNENKISGFSIRCLKN